MTLQDFKARVEDINKEEIRLIREIIYNKITNWLKEDSITYQFQFDGMYLIAEEISIIVVKREDKGLIQKGYIIIFSYKNIETNTSCISYNDWLEKSEFFFSYNRIKDIISYLNSKNIKENL